MTKDMALLLQSVLSWTIGYLFIFLICKIFGITGNQLVITQRRLERLSLSNRKLIAKLGSEYIPVSFVVRKLKLLAFFAKRIVKILDIYIFDHHENKHIIYIQKLANNVYDVFRNTAETVNKTKDLSIEKKLVIIDNSIVSIKNKIGSELKAMAKKK